MPSFRVYQLTWIVVDRLTPGEIARRRRRRRRRARQSVVVTTSLSLSSRNFECDSPTTHSRYTQICNSCVFTVHLFLTLFLVVTFLLSRRERENSANFFSRCARQPRFMYLWCTLRSHRQNEVSPCSSESDRHTYSFSHSAKKFLFLSRQRLGIYWFLAQFVCVLLPDRL